MKKLMITIVCSVVFVFAAFSVSGDADAGGDAAAFYADCIDKKITHCDGKGDLWNSRSKNLRSCSRMALLKAIFLSANKVELIRDMEANGVALKTARVDYYLNKRFYENLDTVFLTASSRD